MDVEQAALNALQSIYGPSATLDGPHWPVLKPMLSGARRPVTDPERAALAEFRRETADAT